MPVLFFNHKIFLSAQCSTQQASQPIFWDLNWNGLRSSLAFTCHLYSLEKKIANERFAFYRTEDDYVRLMAGIWQQFVWLVTRFGRLFSAFCLLLFIFPSLCPPPFNFVILNEIGTLSSLFYPICFTCSCSLFIPFAVFALCIFPGTCFVSVCVAMF